MIYRFYGIALSAAFALLLGLPATASAAPAGNLYQSSEPAGLIFVADDEEMMMEGDDGAVDNDELMDDEMMDDEPGDDMMDDEEMESEDEAM